MSKRRSGIARPTTVVWLNTSSANYHFKGDPWYGRTQRDTYVCKVEADKDGTRMDKFKTNVFGSPRIPIPNQKHTNGRPTPMPDGQNWRNATMVARTAVHLPGLMRVASASGWNGA
jgi:hypothetical protein